MQGRHMAVQSATLPIELMEGAPVVCDPTVMSALVNMQLVIGGRATSYGESLLRSQIFSLCAIQVALKVSMPDRINRLMGITRHALRFTMARIPEEYLWVMRRTIRDIDPQFVGEVYQYLNPDSLHTRAIAFTYARPGDAPVLFYKL